MEQLDPSVATQFDLRLCPIRFLRVFCDRARPLRGNRPTLFFPSSKPHSLMNRNVLGTWVRRLIVEAYVTVDRPLPPSLAPHETRALSASIALQRNVSLSHILEGCSWKSTSVFARCYLRNLVEQGPLQDMSLVLAGTSLPAPRARIPKKGVQATGEQ